MSLLDYNEETMENSQYEERALVDIWPDLGNLINEMSEDSSISTFRRICSMLKIAPKKSKKECLNVITQWLKNYGDQEEAIQELRNSYEQMPAIRSEKKKRKAPETSENELEYSEFNNPTTDDQESVDDQMSTHSRPFDTIELDSDSDLEEFGAYSKQKSSISDKTNRVMFPKKREEFFEKGITLKQKKEIMKKYEDITNVPSKPPSMLKWMKPKFKYTIEKEKDWYNVQKNFLDAWKPIAFVAEQIISGSNGDKWLVPHLQDLSRILIFAHESITKLRRQNVLRDLGGSDTAKQMEPAKDANDPELNLFSDSIIDDFKKAKKLRSVLPQKKSFSNDKKPFNLNYNRYNKNRQNQGRQRQWKRPYQEKNFQERTTTQVPQKSVHRQ